MEVAPFFFPFCVAVALALLMSVLAIRLGERYGLYADPRKLRFFQKRIVALGGLPLFTAFFLVAMYALLSVPAGADDIYSRPAMVRIVGGVFWGALLLVGGGLYSLKARRHAWLPWLLLVVAVGIAYAHHLRIEALAVLNWKIIRLNGFSFPLTLLWFVLVVAIFEILDSVEGLANIGLVLGSVLGFALVDFTREVYVPFLYAALGGASLGCLRTNNFRPRMVYGPTGNKLVGFLFAAVTIIARQKETVVQVVIFPVALAALVVVFFAAMYLEARHAASGPSQSGGQTPEQSDSD